MNEAVKKYVENMKKHIVKCKNSPILSQFQYSDIIISRTNYIINFFESIYSNKHTNFFTNFSYLSADLSINHYSSKEKLEIIMAAVKKNIDIGILEFKTQSISTSKKQSIEEIAIIIDQNGIIEGHRIILNHYLKKPQYNLDDIEKIDDALVLLGIGKNTRQEIHNVLIVENQKKLNKKEKQNKKSKNNSMQTNGMYSLNEYYDKQKERKQIVEELNSYYDYEKMEVTRPLSTQEKIHCIKLLEMLGCSKEEQLKFLRMIENYPQKYNNPIAQFADNYEKLKYYEQKYCLSEYLKRLQDYLEIMFICDDKEYSDWKDEFEQELGRLIKLLPKTYEYELSKRKTKVK